MSEYLSDEQQAEKLKKVIRDYGYTIVISVLLALTAYFGWQYWQQRQAANQATIAQAFDKVSELSQQLNMAVLSSDTDTATLETAEKSLTAGVQKLVQDYPNTMYAWQSLMLLAKYQTEQNKLTEAEKTLTQVSKVQLKDAGLQAIATLRLAQVLLANNKADNAISLLNTSLPTAFEASKQELLGDIYAQKNDKIAAKKAYELAWQRLEERQQDRAILRLKMESLGLNPQPIKQAELVKTQENV